MSILDEIQAIATRDATSAELLAAAHTALERANQEAVQAKRSHIFGLALLELAAIRESNPDPFGSRVESSAIRRVGALVAEASMVGAHPGESLAALEALRVFYEGGPPSDHIARAMHEASVRFRERLAETGIKS